MEMIDENVNKLIEEIGKVLANAVYDSEELQELLNKVRSSGYQPMIAIEAKLTLFKDSEEEGAEKYDIKNKLLDKLSYDMDFDELVTSEDQKFLNSIHIKLE
jgi:hypothetical protein